MSRPTFEEFKKEALSNLEVKKEYNRLAPIFEIKKELLSARLRKGLTQEEVAKRMKTSRSNISRLESLNNTYTPSLNTLIKYAKALDCEIKVSLQ